MIYTNRWEIIEKTYISKQMGLFQAFLSSARSSELFMKNLHGHYVPIDISRTHREEIRKLKKRYAEMKYRLKKDGIISPNEILTAKGRKLYKDFLIRRKTMLSLKNNYSVEKNNSIILVLFDIPEKLKSYRRWLRKALKSMGFEMLQKSVWMGKIKICPDFFNDLERYNILQYMDIVEISKTGSIEKIL